MTSLAQQLLDISDSLTPDNWRKGRYFSYRNNTLCMCAHGAVQAHCNPQVQQALREYPNSAGTAPPEDAGEAAEEAATRVRRTSPAAAIRSGQSPQQVWTNRPDWIKQDYILGGKNYGNLDLHYLLGMVGLTVPFNDNRSTTLEAIKKKFKEASVLAKQLGV